MRENKLKELTTIFWKLHDKYASETNEAEIRLSGYCTQETLTKMKSCLVQGFQQIETIYEELKNKSTAVPDQNVCLGIDRLKADKDLLVAATLLRMTNDNISQHSSNTRSTQASKHSLRSSQRSRRSGSTTTSSKARAAEANAPARRTELEAQREVARKEEELNNLELEETSGGRRCNAKKKKNT